MKPAWCVGMLLTVAPLIGRAQSGWTVLFDGKTMTGWEDPRQKTPPGDAWTIDDGCLKANRHPRITEDLFTKQLFRDFELVFDWRVAPGANSGVKYRIQDRVLLAPGFRGRFEDLVNYSIRNRVTARPNHGQEYVVGFEYQILDNARNPDARNGTTHRAGALYDLVGPSKDVTRPVGQFNHSRLVVKGNHVEHWLNGVKVVDAELDSPEAAEHIAKRWGRGSPVYEEMTKQPRKDCPISLQNHDGDTWFRNIKIRGLD
jgi:3-keto-disaccharide hydrolase